MGLKFGSGGELPRQSVSAEDDSDEGVTPGFIATLAVAVVVGFGGAYYYLSQEDEMATFVSKADPICAQYWVSPGWNDEAMICYMVEQVDRLCDPRERLHLAAKVQLYRTESERLKGKVIREAVLNQKDRFAEIKAEVDNFGKNTSKPRKVEKKKPRKYGKNYTVEESVAMFQQKVMNPDARYQNTELSDHLRVIFAKGYMKPWEFGTIKDRIVRDAMDGVESPATSPCGTDVASN